MPRLAKSLETLRSQVNDLWPDRDKSNDGWIGDTAHSRRKSDHNPNARGVVTAIDITRDQTDGPDCEQLALSCLKDSRVKYVIYNRRIASQGGTWRRYRGSNPHTQHVHISVSSDPSEYDDGSPWQLNPGEFSAVGLYDEPVKPLIDSTTVKASIAGIGTASVALWQRWEFWAILVIIAIFGYIIWERNNKPDIFGWFRRR